MLQQGRNSTHELQAEGEGLNLGPRGQMLSGGSLARDLKSPIGFMDMLYSQFFALGKEPGAGSASQQITQKPRELA